MNATPTDPYGWVESWAWPLIASRPFPGCADLVLLRLAAYGDKAGTARPSAVKLAELVGGSERAFRDALEDLRNLGVIDGEPRAGRTTTWRFVTDEDERERLRASRDGSEVKPAGRVRRSGGWPTTSTSEQPRTRPAAK